MTPSDQKDLYHARTFQWYLSRWQISDTLLPSEVIKQKIHIEYLKTEVFSEMSEHCRASCEQQLNPALEGIEKSLDRIFDNLTCQNPDANGLGSNKVKINVPPDHPNYVLHSWELFKDRLSTPHDHQKLYQLAVCIRREILANVLKAPNQAQTSLLLDVYTTIHELHPRVRCPQRKPINPYSDFAEVALQQGVDDQWNAQVFFILQDLVRKLGMPTNDGFEALLFLCQSSDSPHENVHQISRALLDTMLIGGLPWEKVLPLAPPKVQEIIHRSPSYLRDRLTDIAQAQSYKRSSSPPRPGM